MVAGEPPPRLQSALSEARLRVYVLSTRWQAAGSSTSLFDRCPAAHARIARCGASHSSIFLAGPADQVASIELLFVTKFVELQTRSCAKSPTEKVTGAAHAVSAWLQSTVDLPSSPATWLSRTFGSFNGGPFLEMPF
jgi:hypothetical protein